MPIPSKITKYEILQSPKENYDDIDVVFDDELGGEVVCSANPPSVSGVLRSSSGNLSCFNEQSTKGNWTLSVLDGYNLDGGAIDYFALEIETDGEWSNTAPIAFPQVTSTNEQLIDLTLQGLDPERLPLTYTLIDAPNIGNILGQGYISTSLGSANTIGTTRDVVLSSDGTKAFISGLPTWSNLIGYSYKTKSLIGLANFPELSKFYINDKKKSYLFNSNKKSVLKSSNNNNLKTIKIIGNFHGTLSYEKQRKVIKKFGWSFRLAGFDALNYCLLAEGKVDAVIEANLKPYDILPLIPIIKNAGAIVTNWKNEAAENGGNILATSNKTLHTKILKLLKPFQKND